jgi:hypothetical protein
MQEHRHLPDINRLSVTVAVIMLAYALTPFVNIPTQSIIIPFPWATFPFQLNFTALVSLIGAGLAAAGMNWLLDTHPHIGSQPRIRFLIIPAVTAWAIGVPLSTVRVGSAWWVIFALGGVLVTLVMLAEYIVVDITDIRHQVATVGLTAVSFALFLILTVAVRAGELRLYLALPVLVPALAVISLRTLYLRSGGKWYYAWAIGIALVVGQLMVGLHYWALSPLKYGLLLVGPAYALTDGAAALEDNQPWRILWIEPTIMLVVIWLIALLVR